MIHEELILHPVTGQLVLSVGIYYTDIIRCPFGEITEYLVLPFF
jgi:hypothetical protein